MASPDGLEAGEGLPRRPSWKGDLPWFALVLLGAFLFGLAGNLVGCTPYDVCSDSVYVATYGAC